jgi:hypothetical protein
MNSSRPFSTWVQAVLIALVCLALSLVFFSPRLWLLRSYLPGTYQWERAHTYLLQCEAPFRRDVEPAMYWRLLPPLVCHALGLKGSLPLALPWAGVVALTAYVAILLRRRLANGRFVFGGTLMFACTSGVIVPLHWLGMNDAWVWLGQLAVAFGAAPWTIPAACLLTPWVDERFIIGLPLALLVRSAELDDAAAGRPRLDGKLWLRAFCWLLPYAGLRLAFSFNPTVLHATREFLWYHVVNQAVIILPWAPLGWWMGLRAAWVPASLAIFQRRWPLGATAALTGIVSLLLAADVSRSIAILAPLSLLGLMILSRRQPELAPRFALWVGLANLFIPAAHIVYNKVDLISPLPLELIRLWRAR